MSVLSLINNLDSMGLWELHLFYNPKTNALIDLAVMNDLPEIKEWAAARGYTEYIGRFD